MRPTQCICVDFRQTHVPDVSGLHQIGNRPHRVFDRHARTGPGGTVDIDVLGSKTAQAVSQEILDAFWTDVVADPTSGGIAHGPELNADHDLIALVALQRVPDEHLIVPAAVEVAGVQQRHSRIKRAVDGCDAFGTVCRAIEIGHAHAAKTKR